MSKCIVSINNISRSFGKRKILDNLSLTTYEGETVAIVGKSGAGKSTLINIIGLLDNAFEGEYIFIDEKIEKKTDYSFLRNEKIGFVFQSYYLLPKRSVRQNIVMPLIYRNLDIKNYEKEIKILSERLKVDFLLEQNCDNLSGGEKQRVSICRALITKPKLIICDEPTGNLDEENSMIVFDNLKEEAKNGACVIIVTHNNDIAKLCDRCYLLEKGLLYEKNN